MNLSLPQRIRIDETWTASGSRGRSSGFLDIANGTPTWSHVEGGSPYSGYAVSIELNHHFNYWSIVQADIGGYSGRDPMAYVVFFPSKRWFDEWFNAIPADRNPKILAQCEQCNTGVE